MFRRLCHWLRTHRTPILKGALRLCVVVSLVVVVVQIMSPATYRVSDGTTTFQLAPAPPWRAGRVIMPLGPAGVLSLRTHRTPIDLKVDFRFGDSVPTLDEAGALLHGQPALQRDAAAAFDRFLLSRLPWVLLFGALAGILVANGGPHWARRTLLHAGGGIVTVAVLTAAFVGLTLVTIDHTPSVHYEGLATNTPRVLALVRSLTADSPETRAKSIQDFVRGLETVAAQLSAVGDTPAPHDTSRILVVSDVHDNVIGLLLASSLAQSKVDPVDAVVAAGDMTQRGSAAEADLVTADMKTDGRPVLFVGGNHEDAPAMTRFASAGYRMLDGGTATVAGVVVVGQDDPQAQTFAATSVRAALDTAAADLLRQVSQMTTPPQVVVVHDEAQAAPLVAWARARALPLTVVFGHDHVASVRREGSVTLVDAGTGGASGYEGVGRDAQALYTFQILDFSHEAQPRLEAVTTLRYTGLSGPSSAEYLPISK